MSVERRCKQIAMNCAAYRTHEDSDLSPGSCLDCAHYDAKLHGCVLDLDEKIYSSLTQYYQDDLSES